MTPPPMRFDSRSATQGHGKLGPMAILLMCWSCQLRPALKECGAESFGHGFGLCFRTPPAFSFSTSVSKLTLIKWMLGLVLAGVLALILKSFFPV